MMEKSTRVLGNLRQALLNWYPFRLGGRVLVIGEATGPLAELLRKKLNVELLTDIQSDVEAGDYDYIVAVDCVEKHAGNAAELLKKLYGLLKDDGLLLLGYRNRFGLKYLCGGMDELVTMPFAGVRGEYEDRGVKLYAKQEMNQLLLGAGFLTPYYYYPMPDAGFTQAVYTDDYLPKDSIRDRVFPYDPYQSPFLANEADLYDDVVREGTLPSVANYYLAECPKTMDGVPQKRVLYAALSTDRGAAHGFATVLYSDGTACKHALTPEGSTSLKNLYRNLEELKGRGVMTVDQNLFADRIAMPLVREEALLLHLRQLLPNDREAFLGVFSQIYQDVLRSSEPGMLTAETAERIWGAEPDALQPVLKKAYIDMIPYNAFWTDDGIRYYDQEFAVDNCPAKYVLFRALRYTWLHIPEAEAVLPIQTVKEYFGLSTLWDGFQRREDRFVGENRNWEKYRQIYEWANIDQKAIRERCRLLRDGGTAKEERLLAAVHQVQLGLLREFDRICRAHGLRYLAIHGTLLGAVRHQGFIPWDDDMDLAMLREDYERFLQLAPQELPSYYFLQTPESDPSCFYGGYSKLRDSRTSALEFQNNGRSCNQGIWIDILPMDRCPADSQKQRKLQIRLTRCQRILYAKLYPVWTNMIADVAGTRVSFYYILRKLVRRRRLLRRLKRLCTGCGDTGFRAILACYYGRRENKNVYPEAECLDTVEMKFEDMWITAPACYDSWLRNRYGVDYMSPPAEEKKYRHSSVQFDPETPYWASKED